MSNIVCFLARADLDLSLAMTTASSLGAIIAMPLNVLLYVRLTGLADKIKIDYLGIALSAVVVVCATLLAFVAMVTADVAGNDPPW